MEQDSFFSVDRRLRIKSWGEGVAEFAGKRAPEALGKKYDTVFPRLLSADREAVSLVLEKTRKITLRGYSFQCPFEHVVADITIEPIRKSKEVVGALVRLSNVTPCAYVQSFCNLQHLIDIGKKASTLAHGVRNPLNAIKGAVVYLSEKYNREPELADFVKIIQEEISRLDNFITRFLSTSLSEADTVGVDIDALLRKVEVYTSLQARSRGIEPVFSYGDIPPAMANSFQIEQAVLNVINNAIEVMPQGGCLTVRTGVETLSEREYDVIEISDTGPGIQVKTKDLFKPKGKKGRGFGLLITREILQYCGGRLDILSKKGEGTTVRLCIPVKRSV